jgi:L-rhamnose mutarotase
MRRLAFKMKLNPGQEAVYKKRHDEIWPELVDLLKNAGISGYSIFLDSSTLSLMGFLTTDNPDAFDLLPQSPVMKRWWQYMKDIMETNADGSPVAIQLDEVFHLP